MEISQRKGEYNTVINPDMGFTADVIRNPERFVGRTELIRDCIKALNNPLSLIAVYGKRGVGKSSLICQIQQMALGDYTLAKKAGLQNEVSIRPRKYLTVYYTCDAMINNTKDLLSRLCNDQDSEDGLLRLVPDDGKELVEFSRADETSGGCDLKVIQWGAKGVDTSKYARVVPGDLVQTFRNYINAIVTHQVKGRMKRDGLLIILDEFDVIQDKRGFGSLVKSLSSESVKFAICGIGGDLNDLVTDHASIERLLEEGSIHVRPMSVTETEQIILTAEKLFKEQVIFDPVVIKEIAKISQGYPYLTQLIGKECVNECNKTGIQEVSKNVYYEVLKSIKSGKAFPTLERAYQKAIGDSPGRQLLLHLLAEQPEENTLFNDEIGRVVLKKVRSDATELVDNVDQLLPRLLDAKFGPTLVRVPERQGLYEFINPAFRVYVTLRTL